MKNIAVILAAGRGERMKNYRVHKGFIPLCGRPIYQYPVLTFSKIKEIDEII